jgi:hypothetical protein
MTHAVSFPVLYLVHDCMQCYDGVKAWAHFIARINLAYGQCKDGRALQMVIGMGRTAFRELL